MAGAPGPGVPAAVVAGGASGSVLLVLAVAALLVVLLRRAQSRRRLGAGSPGERIAGAWLEFTDALRLAGRPVPRHLAATEAAAYAAAVPRPRRVREVTREVASVGALRRAVPGRAADERAALAGGSALDAGPVDELRVAPETIERLPVTVSAASS